jgi:hypothetical protein
MARVLVTITVALATVALAGTADAEWQGNKLALRTSGSLLRPGDTLRVELLALDTLYGPFATRVRYRYPEWVTERDDDGRERRVQQERVLTRPPGPLVDGLHPRQRLLLDDTFHLGSGSTPGAYRIEVDLLGPGHEERFETVRTCALLQDDGASPQGGCDFTITGLERTNADDWLTLAGTFPQDGWFYASLLRDDRVVGLLDSGVFSSGTSDLELASPILPRLAGQTVDVVVHDLGSNTSATLSRLVIPVVKP